MNISEIIMRSRNGEPCTREQIIWMLSLPPSSPESYQIMAEARRISQELTPDRAEVHAQFALNLAPCPMNCKFCSFAVINKIFEHSFQLTAEQAVKNALILEAEGASAIFVMSTALYDFGDFLEMGREIKRHLKPETPFIANCGDGTTKEAMQLKDAGFTGVYHALRLREGRDTAIDPAKRIKSINAFKEAGLALGTCVEPVGPEHTSEEIADMILFTGSLQPAYSGLGRRISIPGTEMAQKYGMISELRQAQFLAVTRLGLPRTVIGNCTHEPCTVTAAAGANLFWTEIGANPRDTQEKTEEGRGFTIAKCREFYEEAECGVLDGPSAIYNKGVGESGKASFGISRSS
ncbi:MAG: radical SAM protein [Deltaproteobacteria bacterium]|nr:radical SAM protein [Deltaproteobacteria bacterium]MBW2052551.1 radical SAM protein [Deltaproteobacteria bacterium]MBW2139604.1 radical SAM protein [Deltaproteobacteria bacterium]MBW2323248.1 radical SAM protein [Deltaproteobacteria bacterium]